MRESIMPGDRFRPVGERFFGAHSPVLWEVVSTFDGPDGVPYVRLVRVSDPRTEKVLAAGALLDRRMYAREAA